MKSLGRKKWQLNVVGVWTGSKPIETTVTVDPLKTGATP